LRDILFTIVYISFAIPALTRPWLGILIWACLEYMSPYRLCYGFANSSVPWVYISAIVTLIGFVLSRDRKSFPLTRETILMILFSLWMIFTTFFALNPDGAWDGLDRALKIQFFIFATLAIMGTRRRLQALIWVIAVSIGFYAIKGGVFALLSGGAYIVRGPENTFIGDNNDLALAIVTIIPLLRYLQLKVERPWVRKGLGGAIALSVLAVLASYSRAGLIALGTVLVLMILKSRRRILLGCALAGAFVLTVSFMPEKWFDRMSTIQQYQDDASAIGRLNAWGFAWNVAKDRPITGGGFQVFTPELFPRYASDSENYHEAHNIFLKILAEQGFPGLFLFLAMGFCTWRTMVWVRRHALNHPSATWASDPVSMIQVSLIGYAVGGVFSNLAYFDLPYNLMAIVVLYKLCLREQTNYAKDRAPEDGESFEHGAFPDRIDALEDHSQGPAWLTGSVRQS
jgi:putative inorganic carbon (hco3(-)) transporter